MAQSANRDTTENAFYMRSRIKLGLGGAQMKQSATDFGNPLSARSLPLGLLLGPMWRAKMAGSA